MNLLNACLALTLTLALFASVVTVLVEIIHQLIQQRVRDMRGMLGALFDAVLDKTVTGPQADKAALRADFIQKIGTDRVLDNLVARHGKVLALFRGALSAVPSLSLHDLMRRLPRAEAFQQYLAQAGQDEAQIKQQLTLLANHLTDEFNSIEQAISEVFKTRAKMLAYAMGVALALSVNIDAVRLFNGFASDPALAQSAIASLESLGAEGAQPAASAAVPAAQPSTTPPAAAAAPAGAASEDEIRAILNQLGAAHAFGLPVGWSYYPYCIPPDGLKQIDLLCRPAVPAQAAASQPRAALLWLYHNGQFPFWLLSAVVTGLLLGLGGPYWFDLAMSLGRVRDILKGGAQAGEAKAAPPAPEDVVAQWLKQTQPGEKP
ncbi:MAG: hypothetical protein K8F27_02045 [Sulfuricellaceae bacterium]|nr:hypothetical protein [Sulfuricellaceae bacterium]